MCYLFYWAVWKQVVMWLISSLIRHFLRRGCFWLFWRCRQVPSLANMRFMHVTEYQRKLSRTDLQRKKRAETLPVGPFLPSPLQWVTIIDFNSRPLCCDGWLVTLIGADRRNHCLNRSFTKTWSISQIPLILSADSETFMLSLLVFFLLPLASLPSLSTECHFSRSACPLPVKTSDLNVTHVAVEQ